MLTAARPLYAQYLPSTPLTFADGRLVFGGDVQASLAPPDDEAWFNYTDYEHDALRMFRWSVAGEWRIAPRLAFLGELRAENIDAPRASALYVRARPFARVPLDIQAGRIPPTFGAFGRRVYSTDNLLIGYPLAYQYLLSIRPDAIPATSDELLRMRARGWQSSFSVGSQEAATGVSPINAFRWDTGIEVRLGTDRAQAAVAFTNGTLCDPRVGDNNDGKQFSARFQVQPLFGLIVGVSGARGAWLARDLEDLVAPGQQDARQQVLGFDAEYSRGHWLVRGEAIRSTWDMPGVASAADAMNLVATSGWVEGRYRLTPRLYVAGRAERLTFSRIQSAATGAYLRWEAPVSRLELGGGVYVQRNLVARLSVQSNHRDGGRVRERTIVSTQVLYWF
ncbi:MAG: hypothetical protein ACM36C_03915 [Acidobacteriota bacterium]